MIEVTAAVETAKADRYVMSLCKQWSQRMDVNVPERQGVIHFDNAVATLTPTAGRLIVSILANDDASVDFLQNVVAGTLQALVPADERLKFNWHRSSDRELHAL